MHMKRQTTKKSWPISRKGTKYIVVASHQKKQGIPLLVVLRDILKLVRNEREARDSLNSGKIIINSRIRKDKKFPVLPFDILTLGGKNYQLIFSNKGKFEIKETHEKNKIYKVIGKKILKNKKVQLNLIHGDNILLTENKKIKIGDSIIIKDKKIAEIIPFEKGRDAIILSGKNIGRKGKIENIENAKVIISAENKKINVPIKNILVVK